MSKVVQGKIVHTFGSIGRTGVAQGEVCKTCPGGCKTDCLRAGINVEKTRRKYRVIYRKTQNISST